jgi:hypothetical protein
MPDKIRKGIGIVATTLQNITSRVKKATGLGVIEFMLRFMLWLCLRNDDNRGNRMCIVTGGGRWKLLDYLSLQLSTLQKYLKIT